MSKEAKEFVALVHHNQMLDAKKLFERKMQDKITKIVTQMRAEVAKEFLNKKK